MEKKNIRKLVRKSYAKIAGRQGGPCCNSGAPCCGSSDPAQGISRKIGYTQEELAEVPEGANLGLGCGNPVALASLKEGETALDLGSGAGFDCFLAAGKVGAGGRVIGVDMTPEMVEKARANIRKGGYENVEFRLGEIENLPVADNSVDAIISNCVINLSPEKGKVFREAFRVLKPGGRLMVSDIVLLKELPDFIRDSVEAYVGCLSGAIRKNEYIGLIKGAGFERVGIVEESSFPIDCLANDPTTKTVIEKLRIPRKKLAGIISSVVSIKIYGIKPIKMIG